MIAEIQKPHVDWLTLSPSLALIGMSFVLLLVAVLVPRRSRKPKMMRRRPPRWVASPATLAAARCPGRHRTLKPTPG